MENTPNMSSEEELSRLRSEGKITDAEYADLSHAMRKKSEVQRPAIQDQKPETRSKRELGVTAFCIMVAGGALAVFGLSASLILGLGRVLILPTFVLGAGGSLIALVLGIISWRSGWGKATVICELVAAPGILVLVLAGLVTMHFSGRRVVTVERPQIRPYQVQNWIESQLLEPIRKWKSAAVSSSGENEYLRDTYLVIDTSKRTVRFVRWADECERGCIRLVDYCDWHFYHITRESRRLLKGQVRLKPAVVRRKRNICKEVFLLMGTFDSDSAAWVEIRPGGVAGGTGLVPLDSFEFPDYKYKPGPDTIDESMLVSCDSELTVMPDNQLQR